MSNSQSLKKTVYIALFLLLPILSWAQGQRDTERFIVKVLSEKPNPFAYYPFNRNLFLPEVDSTRITNSETEAAIILLHERDSVYLNKSFVDAFGAPIKTFASPKGRSFSSKGGEAFFYKKQQFHLRQYPNMGRFLYFFSTRK